MRKKNTSICPLCFSVIFKFQYSGSNVPYINSTTIVHCQRQLEYGRCQGNAVCIRNLKKKMTNTLEIWVEMRSPVTEKSYSVTPLSGSEAMRPAETLGASHKH